MNTQSSYDRVAEEYVRRLFDELNHKPLDRQILDRFVATLQGRGPVCELGCGPGQVARYLHERGVPITGIDISPTMVAQAQHLNPDIPFQQGDMNALAAADATWAGLVAFYSLIHIPRVDMVTVLRELRRVLRPGGIFLLSFHIGSDHLHLDEWWGHAVNVDFYLFEPTEMLGYLQAAGFAVQDLIEREPYPDVEHQSRRCYIFALNPMRE